MEKFRWGFIGAGMIAKKALYPAISKSNTGEIYAVASRDADKAMTISPKGLIKLLRRQQPGISGIGPIV